MSKVTMQDIADALGTSRVTVWKTFNHRPGVSDEMKEKIIAKAHELDTTNFPLNHISQRFQRQKLFLWLFHAPGFLYFLDKHHSPYGTGTFFIQHQSHVHLCSNLMHF